MDVLHELKDGKYTGEIVDITATDTPSGHQKISWLLRITGGQYDGACVEKNYYLTSDSAIAFLKKELKLIKFEIEDGDDFQEKIPQIIGTVIEFTALNNSQGYLVFYVKGLVKDAAGDKNSVKKKKTW